MLHPVSTTLSRYRVDLQRTYRTLGGIDRYGMDHKGRFMLQKGSSGRTLLSRCEVLAKS